jgi:hypothetical protein
VYQSAIVILFFFPVAMLKLIILQQIPYAVPGRPFLSAEFAFLTDRDRGGVFRNYKKGKQS